MITWKWHLEECHVVQVMEEQVFIELYITTVTSRSGVVLAMCHRREWFIHLRAQGLSK